MLYISEYINSQIVTAFIVNQNFNNTWSWQYGRHRNVDTHCL